jgi:hypothetical protein
MKRAQDSIGNQEQGGTSRKQGKKPYATPAWEVEESFGSAVTCNKADDSCSETGPIQS